MPIIIPKDIPAYGTLKKENIFVMTERRAVSQDIRPIEIAIVNLMPTKIETETQLIRLLSNSPLQVRITLIKTSTYTGKNTSLEHLEKFYKTFNEIKGKKFDGMIITGAPVETLEFSQVKYWEELKEIMEYAKENVTSTIYICWAAQAGLYYHYGINKRPLDKKIFGIYKTQKKVEFEPLLKGVDDIFYVPHSRYTTILVDDIKKEKELTILASSKEAGATIVKSKDGKNIFITGHIEYDRETLDNEYRRDKDKGMDTLPPENYYDEKGKILFRWNSIANLLYSNWLNYYVYQVTPYEFKKDE